MEIQDILKTSVGTKEVPKLKPAKVVIASMRIRNETKKGEKMYTPLLIFECKHPEKEELISLNNVKFEKGGKLKSVALWIKLDDEQKFKKGSAVSAVLTYLGVENLEQVIGKEMETVLQGEDSQFLCLKAY